MELIRAFLIILLREFTYGQLFIGKKIAAILLAFEAVHRRLNMDISDEKLIAISAKLGNVIKSSTEIFQSDSMHTFASVILKQVKNILGMDEAALYCASIRRNNTFRILSATGDTAQLLSSEYFVQLPEHVLNGYVEVLEAKHSIHSINSFIGYHKTSHDNENLLFISHRGRLSALDKQLLEIYSANVAIAYENMLMQEDIINSQNELIYILGNAVEGRSGETGWHVKRIAHICHLLALKAGLSEEDAELIKLASPLHDIGKMCIPDLVLNKPGPHTDSEWVVMKTHAEAGYQLLRKSDRKVLRTASIIAWQHHEKWDGSGYPNGLKGDDIDIAARICALADVFDALGSVRCYKQPWPLERILEYITHEEGHHFDPALVHVFMSNISEFCAVRKSHPDE